MESSIAPNSYLFLRLPNELIRLVEIKANTIIEVSKFGSFPANLLLGRPYYHTYEILEKRENEAFSRLRIVTPLELNADTIAEEETKGEGGAVPVAVEAETGASLPEVDAVVAEIAKNNRLTVDDASRQALSQHDIEELKKSAEGKDIIAKILAGHAGLDEKTAFSKAKYMVRKKNKYLKRFTVLPMNTRSLMAYISEKEAGRIMDIREETLGLVTAWSNAHVSPLESLDIDVEGQESTGGRWLVVDETGGLVVAALAERMAILHARDEEGDDDEKMEGVEQAAEMVENENGTLSKVVHHRDFPMPAKTDSITVLHSAVQPNISLLKYFGYDANNPDQTHPLHTHLRPISWLQLLHPEEDPTYTEPAVVTQEELETWKSGKRGAYYKKRRRRERCETIVNDARAGGFEGLIIASNMDPSSILPHAVPLVRGGGHVVIYNPTIEPLVKVMDLYSKERRTAYISHLTNGTAPPKDDFPLDPRLLLAPTLQTSRVRQYQVLPGRTHPLMTSKGGVEGYLFTGRRVIPLEGGVEARGNYVGRNNKRKAEEPAATEPVAPQA